MHPLIRDLTQGYLHPEGLPEHARVRVIEEAGLYLHPEAAAFFLDVLRTTEEDEAFRKILDRLDVYRVNEEHLYLAIGDRIRHLVEHAQHVLTRIFAIQAAPNFADVPGMFAAVSAVLLDPRAPEASRLNGIRFMRQFGNSEQSRAVLRQLLADPELSKKAAELLAHWGVK